MPTFDFHLPDFKAGMDQAQLAADVKKLKDYVYMLNEQLRYQFSHIDEENIAEGAVTEDSLGTDLKRKVMTAAGDYSILKQTANAIEAKVVAAEGDIGALEITAQNISAEVSSTQIFRAADQTALLALLAAHDPVVSLAVGLLWYDTTNKLVKRCTVVSPVTWETLQTDEVHTSSIDIAQDSIDIASTGSINLSAASQITIGTNPLEVGGTNLIPGTSNEYADIVFIADEWRYCTEECDAADIGLIPGELATVSAYIKCPAGVPSNGIEIGWVAFDSGDDVIELAEGNGILSSSEGVSQATFTVPAGTEYIKFYLNTNPFENYTGTIQYKRLKLERGNVATAWCEAEGELHNSSITIDNTGIAIATGGTFSVESGNFDIDTDGTIYIGDNLTINPNSSIEVGAIGDHGNYIDFGDSAKIILYKHVNVVGAVYAGGNVSAASFTDRTPIFTGDALSVLAAIKDDGLGGIDHASLPPFAQKTLIVTVLDEKGQIVKDKTGQPLTKEEPGRDIGAMVSILTKAVQELVAVNGEQNARIGKLEETVINQQKQIDQLLGAARTT